jgi:hypothetical protein
MSAQTITVAGSSRDWIRRGRRFWGAAGAAALLLLFQPISGRAATNTFLFTYANRAALLAAGWSFNALTNAVTQSVGAAVFAGVAQNTEITDTNLGAVVWYAQTNGALGAVTRIPCDVGHIWGSSVAWTNGSWPSLPADSTANQTRNSLFHGLPTNWVSLRLQFAFAPPANYEGVNLLLYQDDDNYVGLAFRHNSDTAGLFGLPGPTIGEFVQEFYGFPNTAAAAYIPGTNVILRLDREVATQNIGAFFSTNGTSWVSLGQVRQALTNTQLGIIVEGASSTFPLSHLPNCDLSRVDIITTNPYTPASVLALQPQHLVFNSVQNQPCLVTQRVNVVLRPIESPVNWTVTSGDSWLSTGAGSGQTPGYVEVFVNTAGLTPGIHQSTLSFAAAGAANSPAVMNVTLIVNPNSPVGVATWKDARAGAMSVWVDDSDATAFDELGTNGLAGTYVMWHQVAPAFYPAYYQAGMELGAHTIDHAGFPLNQAAARYQLESNILALVTGALVPPAGVIALAWPAGVTSVDEESVAADYFLISRGYNFNQLENPSPEDFMNVKSYNSHEHYPFPPADLKTVVDAAIAQGKWFNLVLHALDNDDGAIVYSVGRNIWVAPGGTVAKYIYQRDRVVITNYQQTAGYIQFDCYRLPLDPSAQRSFETALGTNDTLTLTANINGSQVFNLTINGAHAAFASNGSRLYFNTLVTTNPQTIVLSLHPNSPPALSAQPNYVVQELTPLTVTNAGTDPDLPQQTLNYTLLVTNAMTGMMQTNAAIDSQGVITWTPNQFQSPSTNVITTVVSDNGYPPLSATNAFTLVVSEVNADPVLPPQTTRMLFGQQALMVSNLAAEPNIHSMTLGYGLASAPAGASINSQGIITWTPSAGQVPGTYTFTTMVTNYNPYDGANPRLTATNSFLVVVQTNLLVLAAQPQCILNELTTLRVTNSATLLTNLPYGLATNTVRFTYTNRAALLADGWSFLAVNPDGTTRNTEITNANIGVVAYGLTNGAWGPVLRLPCDTGNLWGAANNTRNALFRSLQTNWVSLRLSLSFAPTENYQQAQLLLYQDDDNYVEVDRAYNTYNGIQCAEFNQETARVPTTLNFVNLPATNISLRLDRTPASGRVNGFYSTDGSTWVSLGQTSQSLTNAGLGIWVGGAADPYTNTLTTCDVGRFDIITTNISPPILYALLVTNLLDGSIVSNATIDANGIILWTPTEAQGPGQYTFTTSANYAGYQAFNSFTVTVNEVNLAPVLPVQTSRIVTGLQPLTVTNTATDGDIPANSLGYQLTSAPPGAAISANGIITWTPSVAQVPGIYPFTTVVTDTNVYAINAWNLAATNNFTVTVQAIHNGPGLPAQTNQVINELMLLTVTNTTTDTDIPTLPLTYALAVTNLSDNSVVLNATIDTNGVITWTPTEAQGPGANSFTTVVTDGAFSATNAFTVVVNEVNVAPVLPAQTNRTLVGLQTLTVTNTATDADIPANPLGYQLTVAPAGALINANGIITWTPAPNQVPSLNVFTTIVTDTNIFAINARSLTATNRFMVTALGAADEFQSVSITLASGVGTVTWASVPGQTYRLQCKDSLSDAIWVDLTPDVTASGTWTSMTNLIGGAIQRFYRIELVLPPPDP